MGLEKRYELKVFTPEELGTGEFDNGKITEIKPIDFPSGTGKGKRIGPLFYWAWASAKGDGIISMHPHQAFEIISYVLEGEIGHTDTLGNKTRVGKGGAQIMQTGSGVYHQEEMYGERTEFFQIWFDPNIHKTINDTPTYNQINDENFPVEKINGVNVKKIIGNGAPVKLVADTNFEEITISSGSSFRKEIEAGKFLAIVVMQGSGLLNIEGSKEIHKEYYVTLKAEQNIEATFSNNGNENFKLAIIESPLKVDYKLYGEN